MFNSYKIATVYEANVLDKDGEFDTLSFESEEDYINYIRPHCEESEIQYMVDNFLSKRDKKVYYEPLFKTGFWYACPANFCTIQKTIALSFKDFSDRFWGRFIFNSSQMP